MSTFFSNKDLPNFHIEINEFGVKVWVSLNIEPALKKHLCHTNVFKANKFWVYSLRMQLDKIDSNAVQQAYKTLLNNAMINIREAKKKLLDEQITLLKEKKR